jgi:putative transposase
MSRTDRLKMIARPHTQFTIQEQCAMLKVPRSTLYYKPEPANDDELKLMRRIDEIFTKWPFYGSRRLVAELRGEGYVVNRERVRRLMRVMGIEAIYPKPNTSRKHPQHKIYPYLLKNLAIDRSNQVWCADITYIPMKQGWVYLVAVMDWFSRRVLAWRLSITMETDFCITALQEALDTYGAPEIFNTDQGVQFTAASFIETLEASGVRISMDGKGRFLDNIFIERLWRSLKYEEVFTHAYASVAEAHLSIGAWLTFYNDERKHQALGYCTPKEIFAAGQPVDMWTTQASALPTSPQAQQQQQERDSIYDRKEVACDIERLAA